MLPDEVHPIDDLRERVRAETGKQCWCGAEEDEDGVIVHNSADGREAFERRERKHS